MVKSNKSKNRRNRKNKGIEEGAAKARKINASTPDLQRATEPIWRAVGDDQIF
jgi:hypothetical protein